MLSLNFQKLLACRKQNGALYIDLIYCFSNNLSCPVQLNLRSLLLFTATSHPISVLSYKKKHRFLNKNHRDEQTTYAHMPKK